MKMCYVAYRPRKEPGTTYRCVLPPGHAGQHRGLFGVVWGKPAKTVSERGFST